MIDEKYIATTTTTYTIKFRQHSLRGKREFIRDIRTIPVLLGILKPILEDPNICDIVVEEKIINCLDEIMLRKELL